MISRSNLPKISQVPQLTCPLQPMHHWLTDWQIDRGTWLGQNWLFSMYIVHLYKSAHINIHINIDIFFPPLHFNFSVLLLWLPPIISVWAIPMSKIKYFVVSFCSNVWMSRHAVSTWHLCVDHSSGLLSRVGLHHCWTTQPSQYKFFEAYEMYSGKGSWSSDSKLESLAISISINQSFQMPPFEN